MFTAMEECGSLMWSPDLSQFTEATGKRGATDPGQGLFTATRSTYCKYHPDSSPEGHVAIFQGDNVLGVRK